MAANELRSKIRDEKNGTRSKCKEQTFNSKRLCIEFENDNSREITLTDVKCIGQRLKKEKSCVQLLKKIKKIGGQGDEHISKFLRIDGAVHALVGHLTGKDAKLQLEAAACITNLLCGGHSTCKVLAKVSTVYLVMYLGSSNPYMQDQCSWALGNLASDCVKCRDKLTNRGFLPAALQLLQSVHDNVIKSATFSISRYFSHPGVDDRDTSTVIKAFVPLLRKQDYVGKSDLLNTLNFMTCYSLKYCLEQEEFYSLLSEVSIILHMNVSHVDTLNVQLVTPAVRIFANILTSVDNLRVLSNVNFESLLDSIHRLLTHRYPHLIKESLWLLGNLTAWSDESLQRMFLVDGSILFKIIEVFKSNIVYSQQVLYILWNLLHHDTKSDVADLLTTNCPFINHLTKLMNHVELCEDSELVTTLKLATTLLRQLLRLSSNKQIYDTLKDEKVVYSLIEHKDEVASSSCRDIIRIINS